MRDVLDGVRMPLEAEFSKENSNPDERFAATEIPSWRHDSKVMLSDNFISSSDSVETRINS